VGGLCSTKEGYEKCIEIPKGRHEARYRMESIGEDVKVILKCI